MNDNPMATPTAETGNAAPRPATTPQGAPVAGASKILVPLDGSPLAETVLPQALTLARLLSMDLTLLRIVQYQAVISPLAWTQAGAELIQEMCVQAQTDAHTYLDQIGPALQATGIRVETVVVDGNGPTAQLVCAVARKRQAHVIAMATHGRSGLGRWVLGSVADEVLHAAPVPLLLVRAPAEAPAPPPVAAPPYQRILVPLDGSPLAEQALAWVQQIAAEALAQVVLLAVLPPTGAGPNADRAVAEAQAVAVETYLGGIKERITAPGVRATIRVVHGDPATEIIRVAEEAGADLIVMATHGRTGLPRLRLGSVATKVVQASAGPILLVRAQEPAAS